VIDHMEYLDKVASARGLPPPGQYIQEVDRSWDPDLEEGESDEPETEAQWFSADEGLRSIEGLIEILTTSPDEWRKHVRYPAVSDDSELSRLLADLRLIQAHLQAGAAKGARFFFAFG
jgi:hypothetical protein